jgi:hypothetical protein
LKRDKDFHKDFHTLWKSKNQMGRRERDKLALPFFHFNNQKMTSWNARIDGLLDAMLQSKVLRSTRECHKEHTSPTTGAALKRMGFVRA